MGRLLSILLGLLALTATSPVLGHPLNNARTVPSSDSFYKPPAGFESKPPGTILRQRRIVPSFFGLIPNPVEAYQLLYRTTAIDGSAIVTATTVFKPRSPKTDRFVSFHTAYDSSSTTCQPSYTYQLGVLPGNLISSSEMAILEAYLILGYIVASPDYEGPDAAFTAGRLEGMGVLDGMRAVVNFRENLGLSTDNPMVVGVGYSGGAIATGWAASLQPSYAPELALKGWVQGGTPANLTGIMLYVENTITSGFALAAIDGLSKPSAYGGVLKPLVDSIATPYGQSKLKFAESHCGIADLAVFLEQSVLSTKFQKLGADLVYNAQLVPILNQNIMGTYKNETPTAPVLLYHASQDQVVPYANASTLYGSWCENGASVHFTTFASGGHVTTEVLGLPAAIDFITSAFEGTIPKGCSSSTVLDAYLNPLALGVEIEPILSTIIDTIAPAFKDELTFLENIIQTVLAK